MKYPEVSEDKKRDIIYRAMLVTQFTSLMLN